MSEAIVPNVIIPDLAPKNVGRSTRSSTTELAERCLRGNAYLALKKITCDFFNGSLVLRGSVSTYHLKQVAQEVVAQVESVTCIDNQIEVVTPPFRSRGD